MGLFGTEVLDPAWVVAFVTLGTTRARKLFGFGIASGFDRFTYVDCNTLSINRDERIPLN